MAKILKRERLVPNIHVIEVEAPEIARKCQPGQFVIIMPDKKGERIPLTIADWDKKRGSITSVFLVVGTSTHKLAQLKAGDDVPVFVGPLGKPSEIDKFGKVLVAGGCFGIAAIYPIARALKKKGKHQSYRQQRNRACPSHEWGPQRLAGYDARFPMANEMEYSPGREAQL